MNSAGPSTAVERRGLNLHPAREYIIPGRIGAESGKTHTMTKTAHHSWRRDDAGRELAAVVRVRPEAVAVVSNLIAQAKRMPVATICDNRPSEPPRGDL